MAVKPDFVENKLFDQIAEALNPQIPEAEDLTGYLDQIVPLIRGSSEDLREEEFYVNRPWVEVQDNENFHELVFHFFSPQPGHEDIVDREYLKTVDGQVWSGKYRYVGNKMFIDDDHYDSSRVYELAFLDDEFFILQLLANPRKFTAGGDAKYFIMVSERLGRRLEWRELMEHLFRKYQNNNNFYIMLTMIVILIIAIMLVLS